jgi:type I restriction enzyme S subunit
MSWRKIKLESLLSTRPKSLNPAEFPSEVFALYSVPGFDRQQPDIVSGSEIGSAKQILYPGDVLLSKIVPHIRRCWVVGHAPPEHRQIGSGEWIVFRSRLVDSNYLSKVLVADEFYQAFMRTVAGVGGSLLRARPAAVADIEIPLPPLDEQKRIAAVLDKADALRLQREATRQLTEKLLKSVFLDMFGDPAQHSQSGLIDLLKRPLRNGLSPASAGEHRGTVFTLSAITQGFFNSTARKDAMFAAPPKPAARVDEADFLICRGNGNVNLCGQGQFPTDDAVGIIFPDTIIAASIDLTRVSKAYFAAGNWKAVPGPRTAPTR